MGKSALFHILSMNLIRVYQCETWCSKDRLHKAKTIDLCQNPLTVRPLPFIVHDK